MSKLTVKGDVAGTGVFTVASPNSNTDRTLTLPDESGTVDTLQRSGNVLQVVNGDLGSLSTTSGSTVYTGTTVSITPNFATSKILALFNPGAWTDVDNDSQGGNNGFLRFEYSINGGAYVQMGNTVAVPGRGGNGNHTAFNWLLTPATTQIISFRVGAGKSEGSRAINISNSYSGNTVTLMEIAA